MEGQPGTYMFGHSAPFQLNINELPKTCGRSTSDPPHPTELDPPTQSWWQAQALQQFLAELRQHQQEVV